MEFRSGRAAEVARSQLKDVARTDAIDLDRLAISLSISSGSVVDESGVLDAADGGRHEVHRLDHIGGREVFRPVLCSLSRQDLSPEGFRDLLRRHLNRGYDLLFRAFEGCEKDWEATLRKVSPEPRRSASNGRVGPVRSIDILVGRDMADDSEVRWPFNREGGAQTNSNARIAGMPGVGKSQVLLNLLCSITESAEDVGFILFDYKGDLAPNEDFLRATGARVLRPGNEPVPVNPFQLPDNINTTLAPRSFAETFRVLSPRIGPVQEGRLVRAMERCYAQLAAPVEEEQRRYPTLVEIVAAVEEIYQEEGCAEDSVLAVLRDLTRFNLFADHCDRPLAELFSVRWVIDLASLPTLRSFVAFVVIEFLHLVARSLPDAVFDPDSERRRIRGVVAVDEAHYYLKDRCRPLLDLVRIGRSKGLPVFLSSQSLEDFRGHTEVNEFLPNTFVLKHGLPPDRRTLAGALHVGPGEAGQMGTQITNLKKFEAFATLADGQVRDSLVRKLALRGFWERER
ncbi:MAG: hypothetical protein ABIK09_11925 [Pseudomonadota bacterium]